MPDVYARTNIARRPVIYAGRLVDEIRGADLLSGCIVLGEQDALPHKLTEVLDHASTLVLLDLPSFPLEAIMNDHWDVPMVVVLPSGLGVEPLTANFGSVLFERLGFFDRIVAPERALWDELRRRYRWAGCQYIPVTSDDPDDVAKAVGAVLEGGSTASTTRGSDGAGRDPRSNKAVYRVQAAALKPRFAAARGRRDATVPLDVLEVGTGMGRWASIFDPTKTRFVGIDAREDFIETARDNFPEKRFDHLGSDLLLPYEDESFDLVFSVTVMHLNSAPAKQTLLSEMWRVARPGGRLLFLEHFVVTRQREEPDTYPTSVEEFIDLILGATVGQVALEHVESLWYPGEDLRRDGLISLFRLGIPRTP
jgi:SAM-dependent methyltransferase